MPAIIDYYFTSLSPFSYLGHSALIDTARKHGATLNFKPVDLPGLWAVSGAVPLGQRPAVRQRYRFVELQRIAEYRQLPINIRPKFFPADPALADHCVIAIAENGGDPAAFMHSVFSAIWAEDRDIADRTTVAQCLEATGQEVNQILDAAASDTIAAIRAENTKQAVAADAIGVPAYVLNGEPFWGQDRIEYLASALESGRAAYSAP